MQDLTRYSKVEKGMKREFLLLRGMGCRWAKCTFCDYHQDRSDNPFPLNKEVLDRVTGEFGVLDIIDSGSCFELDGETLEHIRKTVVEKNIHTLWFETHYMYRPRLGEFASLFPCNVKFRTGIETFNPALRTSWNKGIPEDVDAVSLSRDFQGICLLVGVRGQTEQDILDDLEKAEKYFEYYSVNLFCPNTTKTERDDKLAIFVRTTVKKMLENRPKAELLIENTDLGVG